MTPELRTLSSKTLVGLHLTMSLADNKARELWSRFMPRRGEIKGRKGEDLFDVQLYPTDYFTRFDLSRQFEKWAAAEVNEAVEPPEEMDMLQIPGGHYVVFVHRGPVSKAPQTFEYIFGTWLPRSGFEVDDRPHINVIGKKYSHIADDSEEEIWIPIKKKES